LNIYHLPGVLLMKFRFLFNFVATTTLLAGISLSLPSSVCADDIVVVPPSNSGFVIRDSGGTQEQFRVQENGQVFIPQLSGATANNSTVCFDSVSGQLGPCSGAGPASGSASMQHADATDAICSEYVPLADNQVIGSDITPNGANTLFSVATSGLYLISVNLNIAEPNQIGFGVYANDNVLPALNVGLVSGPSFQYSATSLVNLNANTQLGLKLSCPAWWTDAGMTTVSFPSGSGNSMTVIRID